MTTELSHVAIEASIVLFDLDGTIIDSIGHFWQVTDQTFRRLGLASPDRDALCAAMRVGGPPFDLLIPRDIDERETVLRRCREIAREVWEGMHPIYADLIPGSDEVIAALVDRGLRVGIATASFGSWVEDLLRTHGIRNHISCIVTGKEVANRKPAPDLLHEALRRIGGSPESAVYIGDSPLDIRAARAAGMAGIGVLSGVSRLEDLLPEEPRAVVPSISEVAPLIR